MKKLVLLFSIVVFLTANAQKKEKYFVVGFSRVCCVTASPEATLNYIKKFQAKNKIKNLELWKQSGLVKEGEFAFYIGVDDMTEFTFKTFSEDLKKISKNQNSSTLRNSDGFVNVTETLILKKDLIFQKQNFNFQP